MADLVRNTHVPGYGWWGPAHGRVDPPAEVAALITNPSCWDDGSVTSGTEDPASPMVSTGAAGSGDDGAAGASGSTASLEPDPEPSLDDLDKPALLELAGARGVEVDKRWGEKRLRDALRDAEEA